MVMISNMRIHQDALASMVRASKIAATLVVALLAFSFSGKLYAADTFKGQRLYNANCVICHGSSGESTLPGTPNLNRRENMLKPDFTLLASIRAGRNAMPAFQGILSDRDIMDVIAYVRTLN
jgi:cytochrome c6